jgi:hypothetical protein
MKRIEMKKEKDETADDKSYIRRRKENSKFKETNRMRSQQSKI